MARNSDVRRTTNGDSVSTASGRAPRGGKRRRSKVNLLNLLLRGRWRNASGAALVFLGVVAVGAVILLLVALIAFVVQRSNDSLDAVITPAVTPAIAQTAPAGTARPVATSTVGAPPTATATTAPTVTAQPTMSVGGFVKVTGTGALGLRLRAEPGLKAETTDVAAEQTTLKVLSGPRTVDDIEWWRLESASGMAGWAAGDFLVVTDAPPGDWE